MTAAPASRRALAALILLLAVCLLMSSPRPISPPGAPTVLLAVDRTLWHRLGLSRWTYERALRRAGARVVRVDASALAAAEAPAAAARRLLAAADALVLSGGGDVDPSLFGGPPEIGRGVKPERDRFERALIAVAEERELPVLGICRGAQLVNVYREGTLRTLRPDPHLRPLHKSWRGHAVDLEPASRLASVFGRANLSRVVSWHGQAVDRPGRGLVVSARGGEGVVEAVETPPEDPWWLLAVQWHPELSPRSELQRRLFLALAEAAREKRRDSL